MANWIKTNWALYWVRTWSNLSRSLRSKPVLRMPSWAFGLTVLLAYLGCVGSLTVQADWFARPAQCHFNKPCTQFTWAVPLQCPWSNDNCSFTNNTLNDVCLWITPPDPSKTCWGKVPITTKNCSGKCAADGVTDCNHDVPQCYTTTQP
jgi:hypothetical protein